MFNWVAEAKKFTPELKILALHGPDRHARFDEIAASDIVVTSYALIRRDAEKYRGLEFDTVVLDEAQHIKNRQTQNAQAVKAVRAQAPAGADRHAAGKFRAGSVVHLRFSHARLSRHGEGFPRALRTAHRQGEKCGGASAAGAAAAALPAAPA